MPDEPQEIRALREALELTPDNRYIRRMLADALAKLGQFAPAVDEYRECLRQAPEDESTMVALALLHFGHRRFQLVRQHRLERLMFLQN